MQSLLKCIHEKRSATLTHSEGYPMYVPYKDILSRIEQPPRWWWRGVPRYDEFKPEAMSVYINAALLVGGKCQFCSQPFVIGLAGGVPILIQSEHQLGELHDDPPYHEITGKADPRCTGNSMTFDILEVIEAWWRAPQKVKGPGGEDRISHGGEWIRLPELEGKYEK